MASPSFTQNCMALYNASSFPTPLLGSTTVTHIKTTYAPSIVSDIKHASTFTAAACSAWAKDDRHPDVINAVVLHNISVALPPTCAGYLVAGALPQGDEDLAGPGVLLAFFLSAWAVALFAIFAYARGFIPDDQLSIVDKLCFNVTSKRVNNEWVKALRKGVLVFSDQQIVTGIAILLAAYCIRDTSVYHFQMAIYLAWLSSSVHLTCLIFLKDTLRRNRPILIWRLAGMSILFVMLLVSLVPTLNGKWSYAASRNSAGGIPARCFWLPQSYKLMHDSPWQQQASYNLLTPVSPVSCISMILLMGSYFWKISSIFDSSRRRVYRICRAYPEYILERILVWEATRKHHVHFLRRPIYKMALASYVLLEAPCDVGESFSTSLWFVFLTLLWGTMQVALPKFKKIEGGINAHALKENAMGFGQIVPLVLLVLPVAAIFEHFAALHEAENRSDVEYVALEAAKHDDDPLLPGRAPAVGTSVGRKRLSQLFEELQPVKPSKTQSTTTTSSASVHVTPPHRAFIQESRFFLTLLYIIQVCILSCAVFLFWVVARNWGRSESNPTTELGVVAVLEFTAMLVVLGFVLLVGVCSSSIFR